MSGTLWGGQLQLATPTENHPGIENSVAERVGPVSPQELINCLISSMTSRYEACIAWETLVANIGGNLGFFMGLTLVTFVEVIEFVWDVIATIIRKPNDSDRRTSNKIYAHRTG
ncbi:hypothetical protein TNCV_2152451 [Trichonephila clavipes]|nr:hypothetical protein TNCV_2152451 [Trichonephila clavipes]